MAGIDVSAHTADPADFHMDLSCPNALDEYLRGSLFRRIAS